MIPHKTASMSQTFYRLETWGVIKKVTGTNLVMRVANENRLLKFQFSGGGILVQCGWDSLASLQSSRYGQKRSCLCYWVQFLLGLADQKEQVNNWSRDALCVEGLLLPAYICKGCDFLKDKLPVRGIGGSIHSDVLIHKICQLLLQRGHDIAVVEKQTNNSEPSVVSQLLDH